MAAQSIELYVVILPNPEWSSSTSQPQRVPPGISDNLLIQNNVLSLSTTSTDGIKDIKGFLYIPDLDLSDPCVRITSPYVPKNATRQANLPHTDYDLIALAPWVSANCTLAFLAAARQDPVRAFIFYPTDDGVSELPPANDPMWGLHDGGQWRSHNKYPVYAVPGEYGKTMMSEMSHYSGNMTDVENGSTLVEMYNSRDYARMYANIETVKRSTLPSLWLFLIIVVAMLLAIIFTISLLTRCIQHKRRQALRRRVANGEVDLEALGIKRLTVPKAVVDQMPLFVYIAEERGQAAEGTTSSLPADDQTWASQPVQSRNPSPHLVPLQEAVIAASSTSRSPSGSPMRRAATASRRFYRSPPSPSLPRRSLPFSQLSCPICLEDFVPSFSTVRELPCGHDFHPECVDNFLQERSSLCPMCKKSVLPRGYCPEVLSNAVVRRERIMRRMRERVIVEVVNGIAEDEEVPGRGRRRQRIGSFYHHFGHATRNSRRNATTSPGLEMRAVANEQAPQTEVVARPENPDNTSRTRRRPINLLRRQMPVENIEAETAGARPRWRKAVDVLFARR